MTAYAAALSRHHEPAEAVAEVVGEVIERLGAGPDVVVLFVTEAHVDALEDVAGAIRSILRPGTLIGATAVAVAAGRSEVEEAPAMALWAGRMDGVTGVRLSAGIDPDDEELAAAHSLVLLPDPFTYPAGTVLDELAARHPHLTIVGGLASAPRGNRLVLDDEVHHDGAVGLLLSGSVRVEPVVSQGCRPIGTPLVVTSSSGNLLHEIAGQPAVERLRSVLEGLSEDDKALARKGLHIGRVVDEHRERFEQGDFLIRGVLGIDRATGGLAVGDRVPVGATVQFQVRDAETAHDDLVAALDGVEADAALLFTCNGRGMRLFGSPDHDAGTVADLLADPQVAGMFCAGEIGPVGDRVYIHGFTASLALFRSGPESRR
jgi:small ligand-binding sensory domain FIST